jgi:transposase-like protein
MARLMHTYPPEYRRWVLEQMANSTESLVALSVRFNIPASTLSTWRSRKEQQAIEPPDPQPSMPAATPSAPNDSAMRELECEVMRLRAESERQRIAYACQGLELAEALVEIFCLRHGMDPVQILGSRANNPLSAHRGSGR